jgi:squalene cyclase
VAVQDGASTRAQQARNFLTQHQHANGGVATYVEGEAIREFTARPGQASVDGWCAIHPCVTAAAAVLSPVAEGCRRFLSETQRADGSWPAYWWCDEEYTTALAAEALAATQQPEESRSVAAAVEWASQRLGSGGAVASIAQRGESAFATSWCLRTLLLANEQRQVREAVENAGTWLSEQQRPDGSWPPSAWLRIPPPDILWPESHPTNQLAIDTRSCFTTATVLAALTRTRNWRSAQ